MSVVEFALMSFPVRRPRRAVPTPMVARVQCRRCWAVEITKADGSTALATDARTGAVQTWPADEQVMARVHARLVGPRSGARVVPVYTMAPVRDGEWIPMRRQRAARGRKAARS